MKIWFISDTHFGHANILTFTTETGVRVRPEFETVEQMDEAMIERWNARVKPSDHIYHLGDVTMKREVLHRVLPRLQGKKRLLRGNHDIFRTKDYAKHFEEIGASRVLDNILFTHIPVHPLSLGRFTANVHGHIHEKPAFGSRYVNISVEQTQYAPIAFEDVQARVAAFSLVEVSQ